jgi:hypothetical protein
MAVTATAADTTISREFLRNTGVRFWRMFAGTGS